MIEVNGNCATFTGEDADMIAYLSELFSKDTNDIVRLAIESMYEKHKSEYEKPEK